MVVAGPAQRQIMDNSDQAAECRPGRLLMDAAG
jgi:hypothetical protein